MESPISAPLARCERVVYGRIMSIRRFLRALLRPDPDDRRVTHRGDDIAEEVREAIGPLGGGSRGGGRLTGSAVYRHLEDRDRT